MAIDRNKAHEVQDDGLILEGGAHLSSASPSPTHSGLKGDWYFKTTDFSLWYLKEDGTVWVRMYDTFLEHSPVELRQVKAYVVGTTLILSQHTLLLDSGGSYIIKS